jgi:cob(I)alamin adenosyltransferase
MKIYTRTGDAGRTALFGGRRVSKTHPRVAAYGAVDELNAVLGLAAASLAATREGRPEADGPAMTLARTLRAVQARLFDVGADLATPPEEATDAHVTRMHDAWVAALEAEIDAMTETLPALRTFILPGGTRAAAELHLARTVCRRAERKVIAAAEAGQEINEDVLRYLNRLSDWLFVAARHANAIVGVADVPWKGQGEETD